MSRTAAAVAERTVELVSESAQVLGIEASISVGISNVMTLMPGSTEFLPPVDRTRSVWQRDWKVSCSTRSIQENL